MFFAFKKIDFFLEFLVKISSLFLKKWHSYWTRYKRGHLVYIYMSPSDYTVQTLELKLKVRSLDNFSKCRELPAKFKKCKIIHYLRKNGAAESACLLRGMCKLNWLFICGNLDMRGNASARGRKSVPGQELRTRLETTPG